MLNKAKTLLYIVDFLILKNTDSSTRFQLITDVLRYENIELLSEHLLDNKYFL